MAMDIFQSSYFLSCPPHNFFNITSAVVEPMMHTFASIFVIASLSLASVLGRPSPSEVRRDVLKRSVDSFIATESPIAMRDLLCNIGSSGACVPGAGNGVVIAGPGKANPDCEFQLMVLAVSTRRH
jgi:glucoamylase